MTETTPAAPPRPRRARRCDLDRAGWYELRRGAITTTTRQAEALNIALVQTTTDICGWVLGVDLGTDQPIYLDPFGLYEMRVIAGPNVVIIGDVGMGKSSLTKTVYVLRPLSVGHRVAVIDKKDQQGQGEYAWVAELWGTRAIRFSRDRTGAVINPLDPRILGRAAGDVVGQDMLLRMIAELAHGGALDSRAGYALTAAHRTALARARSQGREAVLADVIAALHGPDAASTPSPRISAADLADWGLDVALDLARLVDGDLAGLVDGPTSAWIDLDAPLLVFDVSALDEEGPAIAVVMAVINTLLTQAWARPDGIRRLLVVEEGYHLIAYESCARIMMRNLKQGRGMGVVTVIHHLSDIPRTNTAIAAIKEASLVHLFAQAKHDEAAECTATFGLPEVCTQVIGDLVQGNHLYLVGRQAPRVVHHLRSAIEEQVTNTDAAMLGQPGIGAAVAETAGASR